MPDNKAVADTQDVVQSLMVRAKELVADPKNQNAAIASSIAYIVSKNDKERNALIAGVIAYLFLGDGTEGAKKNG